MTLPRGVTTPKNSTFWEMLTPSARTALTDVGTVVRRSATRTVCARGRCGSVHIVLDGYVRAMHVGAESQTLVAVYGPGDLIDPVAVVERDAHCTQLQAVDAADTIQAPLSEFIALSKEHGTIGWGCAAVLCRHVPTHARGHSSNSHLASTRIAAMLLDLAISEGVRTTDGVEVGITQEHLGLRVGASRETTSRLMRALSIEGTVTTIRGYQIVHDVDRLAWFASGHRIRGAG